MAHILLFGGEARCAPVRAQLIQWGLTVASPAEGAPEPACVGVDVCDVVLVVGDDASGADGSDARSDGGRGAVSAAPRLYLPEGITTGEQARILWAGIQEACRIARERRAGVGGAGPDVGEDVHQLGHELRSPLTAIKTALEVMEGDLHSWHVEPADIEAQLKMLQIALRNVRRLHRAVEWSQMLLAGPRSEDEIGQDDDAGASAPAPRSEFDASQKACLSSAN